MPSTSTSPRIPLRQRLTTQIKLIRIPLQILLFLPIFLSLSWFLLFPLVSLTTGESKVRGVYLDEHGFNPGVLKGGLWVVPVPVPVSSDGYDGYDSVGGSGYNEGKDVRGGNASVSEGINTSNQYCERFVSIGIECHVHTTLPLSTPASASVSVSTGAFITVVIPPAIKPTSESIVFAFPVPVSIPVLPLTTPITNDDNDYNDNVDYNNGQVFLEVYELSRFLKLGNVPKPKIRGWMEDEAGVMLWRNKNLILIIHIHVPPTPSPSPSVVYSEKKKMYSFPYKYYSSNVLHLLGGMNSVGSPIRQALIINISTKPSLPSTPTPDPDLDDIGIDEDDSDSDSDVITINPIPSNPNLKYMLLPNMDLYVATMQVLTGTAVDVGHLSLHTSASTNTKKSMKKHNANYSGGSGSGSGSPRIEYRKQRMKVTVFTTEGNKRIERRVQMVVDWFRFMHIISSSSSTSSSSSSSTKPSHSHSHYNGNNNGLLDYLRGLCGLFEFVHSATIDCYDSDSDSIRDEDEGCGSGMRGSGMHYEFLDVNIDSLTITYPYISRKTPTNSDSPSHIYNNRKARARYYQNTKHTKYTKHTNPNALLTNQLSHLYRTLSTLEERLHHSIHSYILLDAKKFVGFGEFVYSFVLLGGCLVVVMWRGGWRGWFGLKVWFGREERVRVRSGRSKSGRKEKEKEDIEPEYRPFIIYILQAILPSIVILQTLTAHSGMSSETFTSLSTILQTSEVKIMYYIVIPVGMFVYFPLIILTSSNGKSEDEDESKDESIDESKDKNNNKHNTNTTQKHHQIKPIPHIIQPLLHTLTAYLIILKFTPLALSGSYMFVYPLAVYFSIVLGWSYFVWERGVGCFYVFDCFDDVSVFDCVGDVGVVKDGINSMMRSKLEGIEVVTITRNTSNIRPPLLTIGSKKSPEYKDKDTPKEKEKTLNVSLLRLPLSFLDTTIEIDDEDCESDVSSFDVGNGNGNGNGSLSVSGISNWDRDRDGNDSRSRSSSAFNSNDTQHDTPRTSNITPPRKKKNLQNTNNASNEDDIGDLGVSLSPRLVVIRPPPGMEHITPTNRRENEKELQDEVIEMNERVQRCDSGGDSDSHRDNGSSVKNASTKLNNTPQTTQTPKERLTKIMQRSTTSQIATAATSDAGNGGSKSVVVESGGGKLSFSEALLASRNRNATMSLDFNCSAKEGKEEEEDEVELCDEVGVGVNTTEAPNANKNANEIKSPTALKLSYLSNQITSITTKIMLITLITFYYTILPSYYNIFDDNVSVLVTVGGVWVGCWVCCVFGLVT